MSDLSRVEDLAQRVADGLADEAMIAELEALMREDDSARIVYLQTLQLHQDLDRKAARGTLSETAPCDDVPLEKPIVAPRRGRHRRWKLAAGITVAAIAGLALIIDWARLFAEPHMAIITRLNQVDKPLAYHQPFEPGDRIAFATGFLELTYRSGTRLVLQGPVDYTLVDEDHGRLELGSLAAEVPPGASGFTVVTPSAEVKDIGTRFAVALLDTGRTEFEVFEGEVTAQSTMTESTPRSFRTGESAAVDDGQTDVETIPTTRDRFLGVHDALNRRTVEATADRFVQGGKHADQIPIDGPDVLLLKQLGKNNEVARKVWIRFDLSGQSVDLLRPAQLTVHTAKAVTRDSWDVQLHGLMAGYQSPDGIQDVDWREDTLTWNNAPGNDVDSPVNMSSTAGRIASETIRVDPRIDPAGSWFTFTIPALKPFVQEDGTVTLMLSTVSGHHQVLNLSAREHQKFPGPLLTFETK